MDIIISHAITALLGALVGAAVTYLVLARTKSGRSSASARAELKQYRERVADHFARTAGLVDQLTDSYKDVFDQLQAGATELLDPDTLREKLAHQDNEVITLKRLGYTEPEGDDAPVAAEEKSAGERPTPEKSPEAKSDDSGDEDSGDEDSSESRSADAVPGEAEETGETERAAPAEKKS